MAVEAPSKNDAKAAQERQQTEFLTWLSSRDEESFFITDGPCREVFKGESAKYKHVPSAALPQQFRDHKFLMACWAAGFIEFGRCEHSFGYHPDHKGAIKRDEDGHSLGFAWLDGGVNWTGQRKAGRKSLKEMIDEEKEYIPAKIVKQEKLYDDIRKEYKITKVDYPGQLLRLQVRLTDRGWAELAA